MVDFGNCEETSNDPLKVFKERRSKITFNNTNKKRIKKVDVECLKLKGKSCDGLLIELENDNIEHFVELKGNKVFEGIKQVQNTIRQISSNPFNQLKHSYIISTKCPRIDSTILRTKRIFKRDFNSSLTINTGKYSKNI